MDFDDILDSKKEINFLTNKEHSEQYYEYAEQWNKLQVYTNKNTIKTSFKLFKNKQVILLIS